MKYKFFQININNIIIFNIIFVSISLIWNPLMKTGYPLLAFLTSSVGRFDDFWNYRISSFDILFPTNGNFSIYPLSVPLYQFYGFLEYRISLLIFLISFLGIILFFILIVTKSWKFCILFLTLYPTIFTISRGNNELILFCFIIISIYFIRLSKPNLGVISLVLMQFIEIAPFFILLVRKLFYRFTLFFSLFTLFFGIYFIYVYGFETFSLYIKNLLQFSSNYSVDIYPGSSLHSISLSGSLQTIYFLFTQIWPSADNVFFISFNYLILFFGLLIVVLFSIPEKISLIDNLIVFSGVWCICSSVSFDYSLIYLTLPFMLLLLETESSHKHQLNNSKTKLSLFDKIIFWALMFLFIPKPYIWFTSYENQVGSTLGSVVNPLILIFIILITLVKNFNQFSISRK